MNHKLKYNIGHQQSTNLRLYIAFVYLTITPKGQILCLEGGKFLSWRDNRAAGQHQRPEAEPLTKAFSKISHQYHGSNFIKTYSPQCCFECDQIHQGHQQNYGDAHGQIH